MSGARRPGRGSGRTRPFRLPVLVLAMFGALVMVAACTSDPGAQPTEEVSGPTGMVIAVPADQPTVQAAVDEAEPGDLILVSPGIYTEAVNVTTDGLTIRGTDRNDVILDGQFSMGNGIRVLGARAVTLQNLTARNYTGGGFVWVGADGYRGSHLTSYRTGAWGIAVQDSVHGQIEDVLVSGSPVAGIAVSGCSPCDALLRGVVSEHNGTGFIATDAGGNLIVAGSTFRANRTGIVLRTGNDERCRPERETILVGNVVEGNGRQARAVGAGDPGIGSGIMISGGLDNSVLRNRVTANERVGIALTPQVAEAESPMPEVVEDTALDACPISPAGSVGGDSANTGRTVWESAGNEVDGNLVSDSGTADLAQAAVTGDPGALGNCFSGNRYRTSMPADIEAVTSCRGSEGDAAAAVDPDQVIDDRPLPPGDWRLSPLPGRQPSMPEADTTPAMPAMDLPEWVDVDAVAVPSGG